MPLWDEGEKKGGGIDGVEKGASRNNKKRKVEESQSLSPRQERIGQHGEYERVKKKKNFFAAVRRERRESKGGGNPATRSQRPNPH